MVILTLNAAMPAVPLVQVGLPTLPQDPYINLWDFCPILDAACAPRAFKSGKPVVQSRPWRVGNGVSGYGRL